MPHSNFSIRTAVEKDLSAIRKLYSETVREINSKDYSEDEIEVWASTSDDPHSFKEAVENQYFVIAETENELVGFSSIEKNGYLDFMYVHKDHQRKGIAKRLLEEIERKANEQNNYEVFAYVSRTAKPFFERSGYRYSGDKTDRYKGVVFINSIMVKKLK
ncbi:MAG: GNAT family N-acetyltransferase [Bacteroidota bacterium]|nr:GNAT family N-acetyltransferase [Bacteroidota bacterium]